MAYWSASVSPRRSWAWSGYVFLKQLGSSHLSLGQVLLHPGMSGGRPFSLDLALLSSLSSGKRSCIEAGCVKPDETWS